MKRAVLAVAIAVGLVIGVALPTSALGLTQVTLNCDDGTTSTMVVDTDTVTGLTLSIQGMIDYPAGLTCTMVQVPVTTVVHLGGIAMAASPGQNPFIVGGGRWIVPCDVIFPPPPPCNPCTGGIESPAFARAPGAYMAPFASTDTIFVNIAVNFHQRDDGSFFGTLNETIPANQSCGTTVVGESHFTSKPDPPLGCFGVDLTDPNRRTAHTVSNVTQISGQQPFPNGSGLTTPAGFLNVGDLVHFSFIDNGNPSQGIDMLQGPPAPNASTCVQDPDTKVVTATGPAPLFSLTNGNITLHP